MTSAVLGAGTVLKMEDPDTTDLFNTIPEVLRVGSLGSTASEIDVTNLDSTVKEYIAGLQDGASFDFEMNWINGNHYQTDVRNAVGETHRFRLLWPDGELVIFPLAVLGFSMSETGPESQLVASVTGRVAGTINWL